MLMWGIMWTTSYLNLSGHFLEVMSRSADQVSEVEDGAVGMVLLIISATS